MLFLVKKLVCQSLANVVGMDGTQRQASNVFSTVYVPWVPVGCDSCKILQSAAINHSATCPNRLSR
jgi:hypothetical protein